MTAQVWSGDGDCVPFAVSPLGQNFLKRPETVPVLRSEIAERQSWATKVTVAQVPTLSLAMQSDHSCDS